MHKRPYFIAEVKTRSPFGYESAISWDDQFELANRYGDMISVHTNPRWGGDMSLVSKAVQSTNKPVLAKGLHETDREVEDALSAGAAAVMVVGRIPHPDLLAQCLLEPDDLTQLEQLTDVVPALQRIVWNSRDLATGMPRAKSQFERARALWPGWLCQASTISAPADVLPGADAILVGQNLPMFTALL